MAERVVIDPLTRIEGHVRIEMEVQGTQIKKAWAETTQYRGIETIVKDRDPRDAWAFVQRICGVCTSVHAIASCIAVEDAIGARVPEQANLIRSMVMASQEIQDHVIHFYHLQALDWVNVVSAAKADPQKTYDFAKRIGSTWKGNTVERFTKVKQTVQGILDSGQLSIFTGGYWDHPAYKLPPEANLMAVAHYLDALEFQRSMIRICTVFGGKNPHPNFLVGGMACTIDPDKSESINQVHTDQIRQWVAETDEFVQQCYLPDVVVIMDAYREYYSIGKSSDTFIAAGMAGSMFFGDPATARGQEPLGGVKPGVLLDGDYKTVHPFDPGKIAENITSAWYTYEGGEAAKTPDKGETTPQYTGPKPPYTWLGDQEKYTWSKAPRYDGRPTQVGPVARVLLAYAQGHKRTVELVDMVLKKSGIKLEQMNSTAGRIMCRAIEAATSSEHLKAETFPKFIENIKKGDLDVFDSTKWEPSSWPEECQGYSIVEVSRGQLSHWTTIKDKKIANYQAVVPTTWLAGGRDDKGKEGPYEASLGYGTHPLVKPEEPLEPMRTIHSYDPCMSCAVHVLDPDGGELVQVVTP
ncbi:nickel-dependent hydrogenase large subunit [Luteococcus sp. OSA5]|uniref:nickel-dependent hydrogenase large subunit n=1 Tax=Luteococcus sp. OSA5 TaxID=3401630 RepID=UPI003B4343FE